MNVTMMEQDEAAGTQQDGHNRAQSHNLIMIVNVVLKQGHNFTK